MTTNVYLSSCSDYDYNTWNEIYLILNKIQTILWSLFERVDRVPGVEGADGAGRGVAGGGEAQQGVDQLGQVQHGVAQQQAQVAPCSSVLVLNTE